VSSSLIRQDLVPMVAGYVLVMGTLGIGLRLARRSARAGAAGAAAVTDPGQPADQTKPAPVSAPVATQVPAAPTAPNPPAGVPPAREARGVTARARRRSMVRLEPGWRRFVIHYLGTAAGGYLLLMVVIIGYYFGISPVAGNFVHSAFTGCALLIGLATPVFIALSWLVERKGWRI
jgi:membrane-bound ClpP family serine protease